MGPVSRLPRHDKSAQARQIRYEVVSVCSSPRKDAIEWPYELALAGRQGATQRLLRP